MELKLEKQELELIMKSIERLVEKHDENIHEMLQSAIGTLEGALSAKIDQLSDDISDLEDSVDDLYDELIEDDDDENDEDEDDEDYDNEFYVEKLETEDGKLVVFAVSDDDDELYAFQIGRNETGKESFSMDEIKELYESGDCNLVNVAPSKTFCDITDAVDVMYEKAGELGRIDNDIKNDFYTLCHVKPTVSERGVLAIITGKDHYRTRPRSYNLVRYHFDDESASDVIVKDPEDLDGCEGEAYDLIAEGLYGSKDIEIILAGALSECETAFNDWIEGHCQHELRIPAPVGFKTGKTKALVNEMAKLNAQEAFAKAVKGDLKKRDEEIHDGIYAIYYAKACFAHPSVLALVNCDYIDERRHFKDPKIIRYAIDVEGYPDKVKNTPENLFTIAQGVIGSSIADGSAMLVCEADFDACLKTFVAFVANRFNNVIIDETVMEMHKIESSEDDNKEQCDSYALYLMVGKDRDVVALVVTTVESSDDKKQAVMAMRLLRNRTHLTIDPHFMTRMVHNWLDPDSDDMGNEVYRIGTGSLSACTEQLELWCQRAAEGDTAEDLDGFLEWAMSTYSKVNGDKNYPTDEEMPEELKPTRYGLYEYNYHTKRDGDLKCTFIYDRTTNKITDSTNRPGRVPIKKLIPESKLIRNFRELAYAQRSFYNRLGFDKKEIDDLLNEAKVSLKKFYDNENKKDVTDTEYHYLFEINTDDGHVFYITQPFSKEKSGVIERVCSYDVVWRNPDDQRDVYEFIEANAALARERRHHTDMFVLQREMNGMATTERNKRNSD